MQSEKVFDKIMPVKLALIASTLLMPFFSFAQVAAPHVVNTASELADAIFGRSFRETSFSIETKVSYVRHKEWLIFSVIAVEDRTGAVVIHAPTSKLPFVPRAGDTVRITGKTVQANMFQCAAMMDEMSRVSCGPAPEPIAAGIDELLAGKYDCRLAHVSGTVRDVCRCNINSKWTYIIIENDGRVLYASVPARDDEYAKLKDLVDSKVRLTGVCVPRDLGSHMQLGRSFKVADLSAICNLGKECRKLRVLPDIAEIYNLNPIEMSALGRHKAAGRVLAVWHGNQALVGMTNGLVTKIEFDDGNVPAYGDEIEAAGFPESDTFHMNLLRATWHRLPPRPMPDVEPKTISPHDLLVDNEGNRNIQYRCHGSTVRMTGRVINLPVVGTDPYRIYMEDDGYVFTVEAETIKDIVDRIHEGSMIEVTGTCIMETESWHPNFIFYKIKGFFIVPRSKADVRVVSDPPWWTPARLTYVIVALFAMIVGVVAWNFSLKRLAVRKGRELMRKQLEHEKSKMKTEERTRLAVELHDTIAQNLTGVSMEIEAANELRGDAPPEMLAHIEVAGKALKSCRDELRNCLWDLRSQALEETDMEKAIFKTLQPHVSMSHLSVNFNVPRSRLADNIAHTLLRVIRELVLNAIRHGGATSVNITGRADGNRIICSVTDNGCGFDPRSRPGVLQGHFGLQGIAERVEQLGGDVTIDSAPGRGTKVELEIWTR